MAILQPVALGLSDVQLQIIKAAAAKVPYEYRKWFLERLADQLLTAGELSDALVLDTAAGILAEIILPN